MSAAMARNPHHRRLLECNACGACEYEGGDLRLRAGTVCDFCAEGVIMQKPSTDARRAEVQS